MPAGTPPAHLGGDAGSYIALASTSELQFALAADGTVHWWDYPVGAPSFDDQGAFFITDVTGLAGDGGGGAVAFLKSDGTVWLTTTVASLRPIQIAGLTGVSKIFSGTYAFYALRADGSVAAVSSAAVNGPPTMTDVVGLSHIESMAYQGTNSTGLAVDDAGVVWTFRTDNAVPPVRSTGICPAVAVFSIFTTAYVSCQDTSVWRLDTSGSAVRQSGLSNVTAMSDGLTPTALTSAGQLYSLTAADQWTLRGDVSGAVAVSGSAQRASTFIAHG